MADPGLEGLIRQALAEGPETLSADECAAYLAERLAPEMVLRAELEHVGEKDGRPVFYVPAREVVGTANLQIAVTS